MSEVAATSQEPQGRMIEGRYRVIRKIAEGGMATVYEAEDTRLERRVAIKIMHMQLAQGAHREQFVERFHREAKSAAAIANPHIVQVYDTGEFNGLDYLVMEYVHGVNLRHDMNLQGTFSVREMLRVISETLDGLAAAHRVGVVHRDIKPENILINDRGHVQITDFGLAKAASQATLSTTGMLLGTAAYLAPEMIEDNKATMQGDLYSVGIMAWEMLAGDVPFTSDNPVTMVFKHVHEDVPSLTSTCTGINQQVADFVSHLTALDNAKLKTTVSEEYSDSVKSGSVISASPDSGTELHWGDSVKLTVSKGPETADVPNLVGKSKSDAIKTLESLGFEVKTGGLNILGLVQQQSATGKTRLRDTNGNKTVITLTVV